MIVWLISGFRGIVSTRLMMTESHNFPTNLSDNNATLISLLIQSIIVGANSGTIKYYVLITYRSAT